MQSKYYLSHYQREGSPPPEALLPFSHSISLFSSSSLLLSGRVETSSLIQLPLRIHTRYSRRPLPLPSASLAFFALIFSLRLTRSEATTSPRSPPTAPLKLQKQTCFLPSLSLPCSLLLAPSNFFHAPLPLFPLPGAPPASPSLPLSATVLHPSNSNHVGRIPFAAINHLTMQRASERASQSVRGSGGSRSRKSSGLNKREREGGKRGESNRERKQGFNILHFVVNSHREPAPLKNPFPAPIGAGGGFRAKSACRVCGLPRPAERPKG